MGVAEVDFCGACDQEQTKVRNLPLADFEGHFVLSQSVCCTSPTVRDLWQPRCRGASVVLDRFDVLLAGSSVWASFFSWRDIGQVHFSNMK